MVYHNEREGMAPSFRGSYYGNFSTDAENVTDRLLMELLSLLFSSDQLFLHRRWLTREKLICTKTVVVVGIHIYGGTITLAAIAPWIPRLPHIRITYLGTCSTVACLLVWPTQNDH